MTREDALEEALRDAVRVLEEEAGSARPLTLDGVLSSVRAGRAGRKAAKPADKRALRRLGLRLTRILEGRDMPRQSEEDALARRAGAGDVASARRLVALLEAKGSWPRLEPGIQHEGTWIRRVRLTESPNEYVETGTVGDLEVLEASVHGDPLKTRFHVGGEGNGFSVVVHPRFEPAPDLVVATFSHGSSPVHGEPDVRRVYAYAFSHGVDFLAAHFRPEHDKLNRVVARLSGGQWRMSSGSRNYASLKIGPLTPGGSL